MIVDIGIPILRILFAGYAHFSQITLPLLVYHPTQIILGGLLVPTLKRWLMLQGYVTTSPLLLYNFILDSNRIITYSIVESHLSVLRLLSI